jgi:hypothetical protein
MQSQRSIIPDDDDDEEEEMKRPHSTSSTTQPRKKLSLEMDLSFDMGEKEVEEDVPERGLTPPPLTVTTRNKSMQKWASTSFHIDDTEYTEDGPDEIELDDELRQIMSSPITMPVDVEHAKITITIVGRSNPRAPVTHATAPFWLAFQKPLKVQLYTVSH